MNDLNLFKEKPSTFDQKILFKSVSNQNPIREINPNAKVKASETIQIKARVGQVWQLLTDINDWKNWHSEITKSEMKGTQNRKKI